MIRVLHLITTLETGGAEMFLYRLLSRLDPKRFQSRVVSIRRRGPVDELIKELGIPVMYLDMKPAFPNPLGLLKFRNELRTFRPHILQTWLYHADLLGLTARFAGVHTILWNIRCSDMDFSRYNPLTRWIVRACARFSHVPRAVLANSESGKIWHQQLGYNPREFIVIPNGYDMNAFEPDLGARTALREELGVTPDTPLVGLAGRFDPMKGHEQFIQAAALVLQKHPSTRFVLCGEGIDSENSTLVDWIKRTGAEHAFFLLGRRDDMDRVYSSWDIGCSSSLFGEGFANTIAEPMACGVPVVATDVGDAQRLVRGTGKLVPPGDITKLAAALCELINMEPQARKELGASARAYIGSRFSLESAVAQYNALYAKIAGER